MLCLDTASSLTPFREDTHSDSYYFVLNRRNSFRLDSFKNYAKQKLIVLFCFSSSQITKMSLTTFMLMAVLALACLFMLASAQLG
ncbi:hypothetical protein BaRGS_00034771, partial [Batillaria attramentaria]